MHINDILKAAAERKASDVHIKVGAHPVVRIDGKLQLLTEFKRLMQEDTIAMGFSMMSSISVSRCFRTELSHRPSIRSWTR